MTALLPLYYLLVALVGGVVLPFVAFLLFAHVVTEALGWVEGARQRRIERAEALVQHLEGQLHRARTHLAALKSDQH